MWTNRVIIMTLPPITMEEVKDPTAMVPELKKLLEEKRSGTKSKESTKGPFGKKQDQIKDRGGILIRNNKQIVVPKFLQAQAIGIAHEGHPQSNENLRHLREAQWFKI